MNMLNKIVLGIIIVAVILNVTTSYANSERYTVQVGAYQELAMARSIAIKLLKDKYSAYLEIVDFEDGKRVYRVRVGIFDNRTEAEKVGGELKAKFGYNYFATPVITEKELGEGKVPKEAGVLKISRRVPTPLSGELVLADSRMVADFQHSNFTDFQWSLNGDKILFEKQQGDISSLWLVDMKDIGTKQLTDKGSKKFSWSPDGKYVLYLEGTKEKIDWFDISVVEIKSGEKKRLTIKEENVNWTVDEPSWSPDGSRIAYLYRPRLTQPLNGCDLWTMDSDGGNKLLLSYEDDGITAYSWSPTEKELLYEKLRRIDGDRLVRNIWKMDAMGVDKRDLTDFPRDSYKALWSPSGTKIAYIMERGVWTMNSDGSNKAILVAGSGDISFSWSPAGDRLALLFPSELWTIRTNGEDKTLLAKGKIFYSWSPTGDRIGYLVVNENGVEVWIADDDGKTRTNLITKRGFTTSWAPRWSPNDNEIAIILEAKGTKELKLLVLSLGWK